MFGYRDRAHHAAAFADASASSFSVFPCAAGPTRSLGRGAGRESFSYL
jgi:hypothetical protein